MSLSLLLQLIRKDFGVARLYYFAMWVGMLCAAVSSYLPEGPGRWLTMGGIPAFLLPLMLQMETFQLDPPRGTEHFSATRPIHPVTLVLSKIVLFFVACVFPFFLALLGMVSGLRGVTTTESTEIVTHGILIGIWLGGVGALLATFARNLIQFMGGVMGLLFLFLFTISAADEWRWRFAFKNPTHTLAVMGIAAYAMVFARYLRQRWWTYVLIGVAAVSFRVFLSFCTF